MTQIVLKNSILRATIQLRGAELTSLEKGETEYMWNGDPKFWGKHSPVLFPIVGTLKNNTYTIEGKEYHLPRHGFARDCEFTLIDQTEDTAIFSLQASEQTLKNYPFDFELQIIYSLQNSTLKIHYKVINNSDKTMPFSLGAHPAFALPGDFGDYALAFNHDSAVDYFLLKDDLVSGQSNEIQLEDSKLALNYELFQNDALIIKKLKSTAVTIIQKEISRLKVTFTDFPNLGLWTKQDAPFICIEPWFGYSDSTDSSGDLHEKEGIQLLDSRKIFDTTIAVEIL